MNNYSKYLLPALVCILICFTLINFSSCDEGSIDPIVETSSRNYIWKEDTLNVEFPYLTYKDMVGNSSEDIWLGNLIPGLWHFDGNEWEMTEFPGITPSALWLFEDNTLWVGTRQNQIFSCSNGVWSNSYDLVYEDYDIIDIFGMYGKVKDDIYAVGCVNRTIIPGEEYINKAIIVHYNGLDWSFNEIPELFNVCFHKITYQESLETYFIYATKFENGVILDKLFIFDGNIIEEIMSTTAGIGLSKIEDHIYINSRQKVYKLVQNELVLWKDFTESDFQSEFVGRAENDFFNNSAKGLGHYNGVNYQTIYPTNLELQSKFIFEKDIFVTAEDYYNHHFIIIHGVLKE